MLQETDKVASGLANEHIEWFLSTLRPLLHSHFTHGFKHGQDNLIDAIQAHYWDSLEEHKDMIIKHLREIINDM